MRLDELLEHLQRSKRYYDSWLDVVVQDEDGIQYQIKRVVVNAEGRVVLERGSRRFVGDE